MTLYRYLTPKRSGKWYATLEAAQRAACKIGAGFLDAGSGIFYPYSFTKLDMLTKEESCT